MKWFGVPSHEVRRWQGTAEPFIRRAVNEGNGDYATADVFAECSQAKMQLWIVYDEERDDLPVAAVVTSLPETIRQRRCVICYLGGSGIMDWVRFLSEIEAWAKEKGCVSVDILGRPGWERMLSDYRKTAVVLRKFLTP